MPVNVTGRKGGARNYHAPAVKPPAPARTREAIAARNRAMLEIMPKLGRSYPMLNAQGRPA